MHAVCIFPKYQRNNTFFSILTAAIVLSLLKIFPIIYTANTFVTEKQNFSVFYISSRNATFFKTAVYINRDNRFNFIPLAGKPVVDISSSPENGTAVYINRDNRFNFIALAEKPRVDISSSPGKNSFPIGASINLTCKAEPRAEDVPHISRWVKYIRWYGPQSNEVEAQCQQPDNKKRVKIYSCPLVLKNLTVDKFGSYTCQSGNDYSNHCTRKSFNIVIQGKQIRPSHRMLGQH